MEFNRTVEFFLSIITLEVKPFWTDGHVYAEVLL